MTFGDFTVNVFALLFVFSGVFAIGLAIWHKLLSSKSKKWMVIRCWEGNASRMKPAFVSAHRTKKGAYRRAYNLTAGMSHAGFWYEVTACEDAMRDSKLKERREYDDGQRDARAEEGREARGPSEAEGHSPDRESR